MIKLIQTLDKPIGGYWDGGMKSRFEWDIDGPIRAGRVRIGSWEANHFFTINAGKDELATLKKAASKLALGASNGGVVAHFEIVTDDKTYVRDNDSRWYVKEGPRS